MNSTSLYYKNLFVDEIDDLTVPVVENTIISNDIGLRVAAYISKIAAFGVGVASFERHNHWNIAPSCEICLKAGISDVSTFYCASGMAERALSKYLVAPFWFNPQLPCQQDIFLQKHVNSIESMILKETIDVIGNLQRICHIRETEVIQGVVLFDRICARHWNCGSFVLLRCHLILMFTICVMISHKLNSDNVLKNEVFGRVGGVDQQTVKEYERTILDMLDFDLSIKETEYSIYASTFRGIGNEVAVQLKQRGGEQESNIFYSTNLHNFEGAMRMEEDESNMEKQEKLEKEVKMEGDTNSDADSGSDSNSNEIEGMFDSYMEMQNGECFGCDGRTSTSEMTVEL
ncbi:uncharacterized protein MONOS_14128 [Monocercomonoides exilis]|uniref:uncharacterized protein n=1 Tax=Monocercomonoides exilis TaxID=2049356 RepID=UPI00355AB184|nr:hypothetical protein MONOS_14128 [Monocercomonoides exilis]|eukprot:MONOS_14128.1-p1 / transcript=MONOS_14128.1 / gene=MONOS_14128 / organism=Monocercomonoides_exilis_PA203 / gene_product=unspecified product / transcript_product=unspecified product / location=Mono_scaffold00943:594-1628(-) / protein_length=344 / sequence_SO=supercontig / SO=protein_coding / is_pseudo=false